MTSQQCAEFVRVMERAMAKAGIEAKNGTPKSHVTTPVLASITGSHSPTGAPLRLAVSDVQLAPAHAHLELAAVRFLAMGVTLQDIMRVDGVLQGRIPRPGFELFLRFLSLHRATTHTAFQSLLCAFTLHCAYSGHLDEYTHVLRGDETGEGGEEDAIVAPAVALLRRRSEEGTLRNEEMCRDLAMFLFLEREDKGGARRVLEAWPGTLRQPQSIALLRFLCSHTRTHKRKHMTDPPAAVDEKGKNDTADRAVDLDWGRLHVLRRRGDRTALIPGGAARGVGAALHNLILHGTLDWERDCVPVWHSEDIEDALRGDVVVFLLTQTTIPALADMYPLVAAAAAATTAAERITLLAAAPVSNQPITWLCRAMWCRGSLMETCGLMATIVRGCCPAECEALQREWLAKTTANTELGQRFLDVCLHGFQCCVKWLPVADSTRRSAAWVEQSSLYARKGDPGRVLRCFGNAVLLSERQIPPMFEDATVVSSIALSLSLLRKPVHAIIIRQFHPDTCPGPEAIYALSREELPSPKMMAFLWETALLEALAHVLDKAHEGGGKKYKGPNAAVQVLGHPLLNPFNRPSTKHTHIFNTKREYLSSHFLPLCFTRHE